MHILYYDDQKQNYNMAWSNIIKSLIVVQLTEEESHK